MDQKENPTKEAEMDFYEALDCAMAEIPMFEKKNKVSFGAGKTKYAYIKLEEINAVVKPILRKYGLFMTHKVENGFLVSSLVHIKTKDGIKSAFKISSTDPQKIGSEITYGKRYNVCAILNIDCAGEDDDCVSLYNNRNKAEPKEEEHAKKIETWLLKQDQDRVVSFWDYVSRTYDAKNLSDLGQESLKELSQMVK